MDSGTSGEVGCGCHVVYLSPRVKSITTNHSGFESLWLEESLCLLNIPLEKWAL